MSNPNPTNIAASVEAKLKNVTAERKIDYRFILIRYATERFFYRLSISQYANQFVLKGGNLFVIWQNGRDYRPTIDSDMICFGNATPEYLKQVFSETCRMNNVPDDGMRFDADSIEISSIREETEYGGTRILLLAFLGRARVTLQFDIGVGDAITPPPELTDFPVLLNGPVPKLKAYPMATTIAEKSEVMVTRGIINSRLKDFYDLWLLSELFDHDYATLRLAIRNTFERRKVPMPTDMPESWTPEFAANPQKAIQWAAFLRKNKTVTSPVDFSVVAERISKFLVPVFFPLEKTPKKWIAAQGWE
ncbi:MAG: nucleotidyl transferase AbiEii/AbiGii toxin family protein [Anaerovoracaceae bacterium]